MKRRNFLKLLLAFLGSTAFASLFYPLLRFLAPRAGEAELTKVVIQKREIPDGGVKEIVFGNVPAIVINRPVKGFIALSRVCTHLGCLVSYHGNEKKLICPCHAGKYDLDGNVLSGPPPKPLNVLPLRVEGEKILVG